MPQIDVDSQGTPLKVGQDVAYNLSGAVVPGKIIKITPNTIHILSGDKRYRYAREPHVSKVNWGMSVLVVGYGR